MDPLPQEPTFSHQLSKAFNSPLSPTSETRSMHSPGTNSTERTSLSLFINLPSETSSVNLDSPLAFNSLEFSQQLPLQSPTSLLSTSSSIVSVGKERKLSIHKRAKFPDLTSSTLFYDIPNNDPLTDMLTRHATTDHRKRSLSVNKPFINREDLDIVYEMMKQNSWWSLAVSCRKRIINSEPFELERILFLWYCRILSLVKLRMHSLAAGELDRLGNLDRQEFQYENYPEIYPDHKAGSIVPFEFLVLAARIPAYMGNSQETINKLYKIIFTCKKMKLRLKYSENTEEQQMWASREAQLSLTVVNHLIEMKDANAATSLMAYICQQFKTQPEVWSALGRIYIQTGNLKQAQCAFKHVEDLAREQKSLDETILLNRYYDLSVYSNVRL
ncbi:hypothetical protein K7432_011767 [Basidiobolus ranarum]|uniref:Trafficking protein particle complex subunit 12 n=1 Tax=Basidiobolus ranarum TaxID=34480 RepID=A0ABR2VTB4_9FUNG